MPEFNETETRKKNEKQKKSHCFWGVHNYHIIDSRDITNNRGDEIGRIYVQQCTNCGKIHSTYVKFYEF